MCTWKPLSGGGALMQYSSPAHVVCSPHSSIASLVGLPEVGAGIICGICAICPAVGVTGCIMAAGGAAVFGALPPATLPLDAAGGFEAGDCAGGMADAPIDVALATPVPAE